MGNTRIPSESAGYAAPIATESGVIAVGQAPSAAAVWVATPEN